MTYAERPRPVKRGKVQIEILRFAQDDNGGERVVDTQAASHIQNAGSSAAALQT